MYCKYNILYHRYFDSDAQTSDQTHVISANCDHFQNTYKYVRVHSYTIYYTTGT